MRFILPVLFAVLFLGIANAGTLSLTGNQVLNLQPGNVLNFTLSSSGNDTAYNLILSPTISGAQSEKAFYSVASLPPNSRAFFNIGLLNITEQGTFADAFAVSYQQGTQAFTAMFPCIVNIGKPTTSSIYLTVNATSSKGVATINVTVFNAVRSNYTVNVTALVPPTFSFSSNKKYTLDLGPYEKRNVQFIVTYPLSQASYTAAIASQYILGNTSYANIEPINIVTAQLSQPTQSPSVTLIIIAAVAIAIILLIARSYLKSRSRPAKTDGSSA